MFKRIEDIEYEYNLEFLPEIKDKYFCDIFNIFNNEISIYNDITDPEINILLAIYYNCMSNKERAINILICIDYYPRALCTLGVIYSSMDTEMSLNFLIKAANMGDSNAINNLAYQYYLLNDVDKFHHYNNLLEDEKKFINLALFEYKKNNNYNAGLEYIIKACNYNNHRAYYIYAIDFLSKNSNDNSFFEYLFKAFKIKPKKQYVEAFISETTPELRFLLFNTIGNKCNFPIELFIKYDDKLNNLECQILKNKKCPVCLLKEDINIKLKCHHSFCESCFIKHKKCILCNIK